MSAYIIFTADHEYYALAVNETCRDAFLEEVAVTTRRAGYAEPYPNLPSDIERRRREAQLGELARQSAIEAARRRGDTAMLALLDQAEKGWTNAA